MILLFDLPAMLRGWAAVPGAVEVRYSPRLQTLLLSTRRSPDSQHSLFDDVNSAAVPSLVIVPGMPDREVVLVDAAGVTLERATVSE